MLKKDDWILTLNEAKNQHNIQLIALEVSQAIIYLAEKRIEEFPNEKKGKAEKRIF